MQNGIFYICNFKNIALNMKIKLNTDLNGFEKGRIITVKTDSDGTITDPFWRRRLIDSKIDNCVEVILEEQPKEQPKSSKRAKK